MDVWLGPKYATAYVSWHLNYSNIAVERAHQAKITLFAQNGVYT